MNFIKNIIFVFSLLGLISCQNSLSQKNDQKNTEIYFQQLLGNWKLENQDTFEEWRFEDNQYKARVFNTTGSDTLFTENVVIQISGEDIYYQVYVADQNNGEHVDFKLIELSDNRVVFENKAHDFPQQITYSIEDKNHVNAMISGQIDGKMEEIKFHYIRND